MRDRAAAAPERPQWSADGPEPSQPTWARVVRTLRRNTRPPADDPPPPSWPSWPGACRRSRIPSMRRTALRVDAASSFALAVRPGSCAVAAAGVRPPQVRVTVVQTHVGPAALHSSRVPRAEQSSRSGRVADGMGAAFSGKTFAVDGPHATVTCNVIVLIKIIIITTIT